MSTIQVLLAGGRAAGRIIDVTDAQQAAQSVEVQVPGIERSSPDALPTPAPDTETLTYVPTAETASGYPVWGIVE